MNAMNDPTGGDWRTEGFRMSMVRKLEEALRENGVPNQNPRAMENQAFQRASANDNKEEYLRYIAQLIIMIKNRNKQQANQQQQQQQQGGQDHAAAGGPMAANQQQMQQVPPGGGGMMPGGGQQGGVPPGAAGGQQGNMMPQYPVPQQQILQQQQPPGGQQQGGHPGQMPQQWQGQQQQWGQPRMAGQAPGGGPPMGGQPRPTRMTAAQQMHLNQMAAARAAGAGGPGMMVANPGGGAPGGVPPNQMPPRYMTPQQRPQQPPQQQQPGQPGGGPPPAGMPPGGVMPPGVAANQPSIPSPGPPMGFVPSPAAAGSAGNLMNVSQASPMSNPRSHGGGGAGMAPSPLSTSIATPSDEDQAYAEKVKQLNKYIEPLKQMIAGINKAEKQKLSKMNTLMEILSNPNRRGTPMETLIKCETVLENMMNKAKGSGSAGGDSQQHTLGDGHQTTGGAGAGGGTGSSSSGMNPLLDAIVKLRNAEQKNQTGTSLNHTLNRSLRAPLEAVFGSEISLPPLPKKMRRADYSSSSDDVIGEPRHSTSTMSAAPSLVEIPDVLQGEVARLQPQFKVSLDPAQPAHFSAHNILLICQLEDRDLPSVPPLNVTIPHNYPDFAAPVCGSDQDLSEYQFTPFLSRVKDALQSRLAKMPQRYSLSQLLSAWEMSVRAACSVKSPTTSTSTTNPTSLPLASHPARLMAL